MRYDYDCWNLGHTNASNMDWTVFYTRLARTIAWCNGRVRHDALTTYLRTPAIEPAHLRIGRDDEVCWAGRQRDRQLGRPRESIDCMPNLHGGRLLAYFPDSDLCDGAAEAASQGFFNVFNMPGWDTWVTYLEDPTHPSDRRSDYAKYLIAYIPCDLIAVANSGVIVNPEECIAWLSDTTTLLFQALKSKKPAANVW